MTKKTYQDDHNLLLDFYKKGQLEKAELLALSIIKKNPNHRLAWKIFGISLSNLGRYDDALKANLRYLKIFPSDHEGYYNLAITQKKMGKIEDSISSYYNAINLKPDYANAYNNLGVIFDDLDKLDDAEMNFRKAIKLKPNYAIAYNNLSNTLKKKGKLDEAEINCRFAIKLKSDFAKAYYNLGTILDSIGKLDDAESCYRQAIKLIPDFIEANYNLSLCYNLNGRLLDGFQLYDWRFKHKDFNIKPPCHKRSWDGIESLKDKVFFVYEEQGLGDTIQFCRFLLLLIRKGAIVIFKVNKKLHRLLSTLHRDILLTDNFPENIKIDFESPLLSLPNLFKISVNSIPSFDSYLHADRKKTLEWKKELHSDKFKIGICWQGSVSKVDKDRSFPLALFEIIANIPNVQLISLHKGAGESQINNINFKLVNLGHKIDNNNHSFLDTAAVMKNCNIVITSDTAIAHLAGALGIPTWIVLKLVPDWRWMLKIPYTPWYPSLKLYRQKKNGDWKSVFSQIKNDLQNNTIN